MLDTRGLDKVGLEAKGPIYTTECECTVDGFLSK